MDQRQRGADDVTYINLHITVLFVINGLQYALCSLCSLCRVICRFGSNLHNIQITFRYLYICRSGVFKMAKLEELK